MKWGRWQLVDDLLVYDRGIYEVPLAECTTSAQVLDWIIQLHGKAWLTAQDLRDFIRAINAIIDPQATICSGGYERGPVDAVMRAQKRYPVEVS